MRRQLINVAIVLAVVVVAGAVMYYFAAPEPALAPREARKLYDGLETTDPRSDPKGRY